MTMPIPLTPSDTISQKKLARKLHFDGKLAEASRIVEDGLRADPNDKEWLMLQAMHHNALGQHEQALACYERLLAREPENPKLHQYIGLRKLLISGMREGYDGYRWRHAMDKAILPRLRLPEWNGEPLAGKKLLVWMEQGIGDIVMFAGFFPWLLRQGAACAFAVLQPKLLPVFRRAFPQMDSFAFTHEVLLHAPHTYDLHVPMGELPRLGLAHYRPAEHSPYLKADAEKTKALRQRYLARGKNYLVGISWHTSNEHTGYLRNIPLAEWRPLFEISGVQFVSLQYGEQGACVESVGGTLYRDHDVDALNDTDSLLSQIAAMDEVVTIQNATAHLAGALGVPTKLLLCRASDWRWGRDSESNPWYASVKILRQAEPFDWEPVIARAVSEVQRNLQMKRHG